MTNEREPPIECVELLSMERDESGNIEAVTREPDGEIRRYTGGQITGMKLSVVPAEIVDRDKWHHIVATYPERTGADIQINTIETDAAGEMWSVTRDGNGLELSRVNCRDIRI